MRPMTYPQRPGSELSPLGCLLEQAVDLSGEMGFAMNEAMGPICGQAARIAGAAFKEVSSLSYEQQDVASFEVTIMPNLSTTRTNLVKHEKEKFLETHLIQEENTSRVEDIATVVIEAYNKANEFCVIKNVSQPKK